MGLFFTESIGQKTEECSILNVLNCIAPYSDWYEIGMCLDLPTDELDKIKGYPLPDQKAHFVEMWYRLDPDITWRKLQQALSYEGAMLDKGSNAVQKEIESLSDRFATLIADIRKRLDKKTKDVGDVLDTLLYNIPESIKPIYSPIVQDMCGSLERSESHRAFFHKLNDCWNFIDFDLLERIIAKHGGRDLQSAMMKYSTQLRRFLKSTTVHQLIKVWKPTDEYMRLDKARQQAREYPELVVSMDQDPTKFTVQALDTLRKDIGNCTLTLSKTAMVFYKINPGSITVNLPQLVCSWRATTGSTPCIRYNNVMEFC